MLLFLYQFLSKTMGNCLTLTSSKEKRDLPIDTIFHLPSPLPSWPQGEGFGNGTIDLGGLKVSQVTSFTKVWATYEGGPDDLGATFFEPSSIPFGYSIFGYYSQPNNRQLYGSILVGKDEQGILEKPIDYTLLWTSESLKIKQSSHGYIWLPTPPEGYKALGHVITTSPSKPSMDKIRCVRSDFTTESEASEWIWGLDDEKNSDGFNVSSLQPIKRGIKELGVSIGTFIAQKNSATPLSITCLKNNSTNFTLSMPNLDQIKALFETYSPFIYCHPKEIYYPSSVNWYFANGALLYTKSDESKPVPIEPNGSNLPQGGSNDGEYWLDLPIDDKAKDKVKTGDLITSEAYLHVKPMLGATFTDIGVWIFYPFNGHATAKLGLIDIPLGKIGEHVGDWEHLTLRISNFDGTLARVYFSQHSKGTWVNASLLEFEKENKPVAYSSLNGHAFYPNAGLVLQGSNGIGIRNDTDKSDKVMDTGKMYEIVANYISEGEIVINENEPHWLNYTRKWGPNVSYELGEELAKVERLLNGELKVIFKKFINTLPKEVLGGEGPTGPKMKKNWDGDEL